MHKQPVGRPAPLLPPGHAVQEPVKYGALVDCEIRPIYPELHVQPRTVEIPILFAGQVTAGRRAKMWAFPIELELGDADFVRDAVFA